MFASSFCTLPRRSQHFTAGRWKREREETMSFGGCPLSCGSIYITPENWLVVEVTISFPPRATWVPFLQPAISVVGFMGTGGSEEKGQVDTKERGTKWGEKKKKGEILVPRYRRGPRPSRLFVIVICITMDETRVMGSWDLPGEHDEEVGERNPLCSALRKRHASAFDQCLRYRRSHCNIIRVERK